MGRPAARHERSALPGAGDGWMTPLGSTRDVRAIASELEGEGVQAVRLLYPDLHGVARGKDISIGAFGDLAEEGVGFCAAVLATDLRQTPVVEDGEAYGDLIARPDLETLRVVPWQPEVAWSVADLWHPNRATRWGACPRGALVAMTERYAELGLTPLVSPELEFFLLERDPNTGCYRRYVDDLSRSYTVGHVSDPRGVVLDMLTACERLGLQARFGHHEFSNSQYEITVGYSRAVDAADRGFLLKTALKEMAARSGLLATFMGKPFNDQGGTGFHVHVSLADAVDGRNAFADEDRHDGLSTLLMRVLAGVLDHAPALAALLAPTVNAYKRIAANDDLVPRHANWGHDNRTTFARIPPERGRATRIEIRAGDGSANAHLVVAALLAAGLDGIERELEPPPPIQGNAHRAAEPGQPRPRSLEAALDLLERDAFLVSALGEELVATFVRMKRFEVERFAAWVTDWELDEYASHL